MYPQVFLDFAKHEREYSDVSVLPTPAFFYGLRRGEEISVEIESGKTLGHPSRQRSAIRTRTARRTVTFELNGMTREAFITDKKVSPQTETRQKADLADALQIGAPDPGPRQPASP
jgi:pyruvate carboxylase